MTPPYRARRSGESYIVEDAGGRPIAYLYFEDDTFRRSAMPDRLTSAEAEKFAVQFAAALNISG